MKILLTSAVMFVLTASVMSSSETFAAGQIRVFARTQSSVGPMRKLEGNVRIETESVLIRADHAVFNADTFDIAASGNVHIKLKE